MTDSTYIYHPCPVPVEEGLVGGEMHLSTIAAPVASIDYEPEWKDSTLFCSAIVICTIILIAISRNIANIFPSLVGSLLRWKELQNIEDSAKIKRDRNLVAVFCILPFWIIATIFRLWEIKIIEDSSIESHFLVTGIVLGTYTIIRTIIERLTLNGRIRRQQVLLSGSSYTYFIIMTLILFITVTICNIADLPSGEIKSISYYVLGAIYSVFLIRKTQILKKSCNLLSAILYLCALEILPTSLLVATAIIF